MGTLIVLNLKYFKKIVLFASYDLKLKSNRSK